MADRNTGETSFFASLAKLGRSLVDLGRAFEGKSPVSVTNPSGAGRIRTGRGYAARLARTRTAFGRRAIAHGSTPPAGTSRTQRDCPVPTYAPVLTAFGIVFVALGAVTVWPISIVVCAHLCSRYREVDRRTSA